MRPAVEDEVRRRAGSRCEYCLLPASLSKADFEIDHIIARKHGGSDDLSNLAWACFHCNSAKGPNLASTDPMDFSVHRLYHPRKDRWSDHFRWEGCQIIGLTPIGRATIRCLAIDDPDRLAIFEELFAAGLFPPTETP
jgi:hypothetical protein